ncbi:PIG-X [Fomitopsis serialis]|uniref:PIG-X n=1 Tax=Fomitopsis serialis TaxID=139415 RepID=UPI0020088420|nr:PIG-X [Neoantrodia serialis]KAH9914686.1 PIG-X [Neoantrodia serialis]
MAAASTSSQLSSSLSGQGFHFTHTANITLRDAAETANCTLHVLHVLPPDVYADQYELVQRPGFSSSLRGTSDLELPVGAVDSEGSVLLLDVELPERREDGLELVVDVPMHARYGSPTFGDEPGYYMIKPVPPFGFWACPSSKQPVILDEIAPHIQSEMFPMSSLSIIPDARSVPSPELVIPVGNLAELAVVDIGTAVVMLFCFIYLAIVSVRTARRLYPTQDTLKTE